MSFLGDLLDPAGAISTTWNAFASLPGTPEAFGTGVYGGLNGDLSWNPYSQDNSVWDTGAGGTELSQDPNNRKIGRQIGTAVGAAFGAGALGAAAGGAGEGAGAAAGGSAGMSSADLAAIYGNAGYGATAAGEAGFAGGAAGSTAAGIGAGDLSGAAIDTGYGGLSSADTAALYGNSGYGSTGSDLLTRAGASAGRGALTNGGMTAAQGGNGRDILKSAGYGAVGGAVGTGVSDYNPGSYATNNVAGQQIINRGITSGVNSGLSGGNIGMGALTGVALQTGNAAGGALGDYFKQPGEGNMSIPTDNWNGQTGSGALNSALGQSQSPTGFANTDYSFVNQPQASQGMSQGLDFNPSFSGAGDTGGAATGGGGGNPFTSMLASKLSGSSLSSAGDMAGSLAGLYSAWKQKRQMGALADNLSSMYSPNSPYAQQMKIGLDRRDAAAGRNSQYGTRAVELQAALANANSRNAPQLAQLYNAQSNGTNAMLNNGLRLGQQSGLTGYLGTGLSNFTQPYMNQMFGSPMAQPNVGPQQFEG